MQKGQVIFVSDIVEENGKTVKENNLAKTHNIPLDALVEIISTDPEWPSESEGVRVFVAQHSRDCDGTPLYRFSYKKDTRWKERGNFTENLLANYDIFGNHSEESLKVIKLPEA